jgi:DNA-binding PadR family transcriptional regulator
MAATSTLGFALLGLLHEGSRSGYDLRKTFVSTPLGHFSDSPGAIYPALRRLARRRWIAPVAAARGGRRRRLFAPTEAGRRALREWLARPPTRAEVVRHWDVLMLRLAFMSIATPRLVLPFLGGIESELRTYLAELKGFRTTKGRAMPLGAQLAFDSGLEGYRAQARWVAKAMDRVRKQGRTP